MEVMLFPGRYKMGLDSILYFLAGIGQKKAVISGKELEKKSFEDLPKYEQDAQIKRYEYDYISSFEKAKFNYETLGHADGQNHIAKGVAEKICFLRTVDISKIDISQVSAKYLAHLEAMNLKYQNQKEERIVKVENLKTTYAPEVKV